MSQARCPGCHQAAGADAHTCPTCRAVYHPACWAVQRCVVAGCTSGARAPDGKLSYSQRWDWVSRVNLLVVALVVAIVLRGRRVEHLVSEGLFGLFAFVVALASAYGTLQACRDDLNHHTPPGGRRPDYYGSNAWIVYMGSVLSLYVALFALVVPGIGLMLAPIALMSQLPLFGLGFLTCLVGLFADRNRLRAALGLTFPVVAMMVGVTSIGGMVDGGSRAKANTRACYANQKTILGAVEMYNLDHKSERTRLDAEFFQALKSGGYLQSIPQDPGGGPGTSSHYRSSGKSYDCTVHGTFQF